MLILFAIIELLLLALVVVGDVLLFRHAVRQRRLVFAPAIILLTALAGALGYVLLATIAIQQCMSEGGSCLS